VSSTVLTCFNKCIEDFKSKKLVKEEVASNSECVDTKFKVYTSIKVPTEGSIGGYLICLHVTYHRVGIFPNPFSFVRVAFCFGKNQRPTGKL